MRINRIPRIRPLIGRQQQPTTADWAETVPVEPGPCATMLAADEPLRALLRAGRVAEAAEAMQQRGMSLQMAQAMVRMYAPRLQTQHTLPPAPCCTHPGPAHNVIALHQQPGHHRHSATSDTASTAG